MPDHNDIEAQRINVVFFTYGAPEDVDWVPYAYQLLTWDGAVPLNQDRQPASPGEQVWDLTWGPFAIEPFRSHKDLFNIWYLDQPATDVLGWDRPWGAAGGPFPGELPNRLEIALDWTSIPEWPGIAQTPFFFPPGLPEAGTEAFDGLILHVSSGPLQGEALDNVLSHELGHTLFHLADTYTFDRFGYDGPPTRSWYPHCAADQAQAEQWWGDLIGVVDPFFHEYVDTYQQYGIPMDPTVQDIVREKIVVDFVPGGCFGPAGTAKRSSRTSLMYNGELFDAVERRWAERVLDAWSGGEGGGDEDCDDR